MLRNDNYFKGVRVYYESDDSLLDGDFYVSVTSILDIIKDHSAQNFLLGATREQYQKIMERTAHIGSDLHNIFDNYLNGREVLTTPETAPAYQNFINLVEKHKIKASLTEERILSKRFGYAGTLDFLGLVDGDLTVVDWKTGNYDIKFGYQIAAYKYAYEEMTGNKVHKMAICQIHRNGEESRIFKYQHVEECFSTFLCIMNTFRMIYFNELKKLKWKYLFNNPVKEFYDKNITNTKIIPTTVETNQGWTYI